MFVSTDHVLYEVDAWLTFPQKRALCLASKDYWSLLFKSQSAVIVDLSHRGGWRAPPPTRLDASDYSRLFIVQMPRNAQDCEEMMRDMRQRQRFMACRLPHFEALLPNLTTVELWGRACALKGALEPDYRVVLHCEAPPVSTRRSTRSSR